MKFSAVIYYSVICLFLLCSFSDIAKSGEIGIFPLPRDMDHITLESYLEALELDTQAGAKGVINTPRWSEIEPKRGKYNLEDPLGGAVYAKTLHPEYGFYLGIQLINTVKRELPSDLSETPWNSPVLIDRLDALFSRIREKYGTISPAAVSLGNEVDIYFEQNPSELEAYLDFLVRARPVVKKYFPNAKVGTTVTFEGLKKTRRHAILSLLDKSEIAFFTYYPVYTPATLSTEDVSQHLDEMLAAAGQKNIILQEIGYPAAGQDGERLQADFYSILLPLIQKSERIDASFIFALHDIPPNMCQDLVGYYNATDWGADNIQRFKDFLCSLGLRQYDGQPRAAYDVVKKSLLIKE